MKRIPILAALLAILVVSSAGAQAPPRRLGQADVTAALGYLPAGQARPLMLTGRASCDMALAVGVALSVDTPFCITTPPAVVNTRPVSGAAVSLLSTPTSGTGDKVGLTVRVVSDNGRSDAWAWNSVTDIRPHDLATRPATMAGGEIDINNLDCDAGADPATTPVASCVTWSKGLWITGLTGGSFKPITDGILMTATGAGQLYHNGLRFLGPYVIDQTIYDGSNSAVSLRVAGSHTDGVDLSRALFSGGAVRLANEQKVCFQASCQTYAVFSGPSNGVNIVTQGQIVATFRSDTVIFPKPVQAQGSFSTIGASSIDGQYLRMPNLPTADPHIANTLWRTAGGALMVSAGP